MSYRHRRRVDWDEEIRKTERIRRRGLFTSLLSFAVAAAVLIGVNRTGGVDISVPRRVISIACIVVACFVLRVTMRHRARVVRERQERALQARLEGEREE